MIKLFLKAQLIALTLYILAFCILLFLIYIFGGNISDYKDNLITVVKFFFPTFFAFGLIFFNQDMRNRG